MELKGKVWMEESGVLCFGCGRAELLEAVDATGSISEAARKIGMSYRHAWTMLRTSEQRLGWPLVLRSRGGRGGGCAHVTPAGRALLEKFRAIEKDFSKLVREKQHEVKALFD